jgi:hypothetical protein
MIGAVAGIVLALVAGCGGPAEQAGGGVSTSSSGPSAGPPSSSPPGPGTGTPPAGQPVTVRGRVEEGVEPGCVVLRADDRTTYLLIGSDPAVAVPGARVEVVGDLRTDIFTTCQQGTPLMVERIQRI